MKIDLDKVDITDFNMVERDFAGDPCVWIYPKLEGVKWTQSNIVLRSSIWRKSDGELVSPGFKKFFNWMQTPDIDPPPDALSTKIEIVEKLDGSCLIITKYKGEWIIRTRRALAHTMLNGDEIEYFKKRYPGIFKSALWDNEDVTFLFEWLTPSNQIVVKYTEPEIRLIGGVYHKDYTYMKQSTLDAIAELYFKVKRPKYFKYDTIEQMLANVADLKGEEGICVYYGNGQKIRKVKSDWYLSVHNFRNAMNLKNIVDLYFISGMPDYNKFCENVINQFQYEGYMMAQPLISQVCDGMKTVNSILDGMHRFLERVNPTGQKVINTKKGEINLRKNIAEKIYEAYGKTNRADIVFTLLDGKELNRNQYKKLLFQALVAE